MTSNNNIGTPSTNKPRRAHRWSLLFGLAVILSGALMMEQVPIFLGTRILSNSTMSVATTTTYSADHAAKTVHRTKSAENSPESVPERTKPARQPNLEKRQGKSRIPTVLLAGTQKASTTALAVYLMRLGNTCFSDPDLDREGGNGKEPHFFDEQYDGGLDLYRHLFRKCTGQNDLLVDGTPETMMHPAKVKAIYEEDGSMDDVKIIFILREPVAREISWYNHRLRYAIEPNPPNWTDTLFDNHGDIMSFIRVHRTTLYHTYNNKRWEKVYGYYAYWMEEWGKLFDRQSQILVLSYDELVKEPKTMLERVHKFLDIPHTIPLELTKENTNSKKTPDPPCEQQLEVGDYYTAFNKDLYEYLDTHPGPKMEQRPFPKFQMKCQYHAQLPMVLVAGAPMSGVTPVMEYLRQSKDVCFSSQASYSEEANNDVPPHFLARPNSTAALNLDEYVENFKRCNFKKTAVDASPSILMHPDRVKEVYNRMGHKTADALKIILVLREPVASHILWSQSMGRDPLLASAGGIQEVMERQREGAAATNVVAADYVHWLKQWTRHFDRNQILLLSHEELLRDPSMTTKRIQGFMEWDIYAPMHRNSAAMTQTRTLLPCGDTTMQNTLVSAFAASNEELYAFLKENPGSNDEQSPFPRFQFECA